MYPLNEQQAYPRAQWYIAGFREEFGRTLRGRTILGDPLVFYRTLDGEPVALWGLCPHRLMPLEMGRLEDDTIVCGYHGYTFEPGGACTRVATGGKPNPNCRLRRYPLAERGELVWIWMGDEANCDFALLPDTTDIGMDGSAGWRFDGASTLPMKARAALLVDNLFDLSHIAFIHAESIKGGAPRALAAATIEEDGTRLKVVRRSDNVPVTPGTLLHYMFPDETGPLSTELNTVWYNPGLLNAGSWVWRTTAGGEPGEPVGKVNFVHGITPETDHSTHYFGFVTRNFRLDDDQLSAGLCAQTDRVRSEDVCALEAIETHVDRFGDTRREFSSAADSGALRARRILSRMIRTETAAPEAAAAFPPVPPLPLGAGPQNQSRGDV